MRSDEAVASLLDLRQGLEGGSGYFRSLNGPEACTRTLEGVAIPGDRIAELFHQCVSSLPHRLVSPWSRGSVSMES